MEKPKITQDDLLKPQKVGMVMRLNPVSKECPHCKKRIVYLGPTDCQYCGEWISFKKERG